MSEVNYVSEHVVASSLTRAIETVMVDTNIARKSVSHVYDDRMRAKKRWLMVQDFFGLLGR